MLIIYLKVTSQTLHPDEIAEVMGLAATKTYVMGKARRKGTRARRHEYQFAHTIKGEEGSAQFTDNLRAFLYMLLPYKSQLAKLEEQCDLFIACGTDAEQGFARLWIENDLLCQMAELGVNLGFYFYAKRESVSS